MFVSRPGCVLEGASRCPMDRTRIDIMLYMRTWPSSMFMTVC